jgi:DNA mismatch endonuclease, patch repair protein
VVDTLSPAERSARMARIRSGNTMPELFLRKELHRLGLRYRLHRRDLPGKPDLVFPRYKAVVFLHGCFWHRHGGCKIASTPKSNTELWVSKFERNMSRDARVAMELRALGWKVVVAWECEANNPRKAEQTARRVAREITKKSLSQHYARDRST